MACLPLLVLAMLACVGLATSPATVQSWTSSLSQGFSSLIAEAGAPQLQTAVDSISFQPLTRNGPALADQLASDLGAKMAGKITAVTSIASAAASAYGNPNIPSISLTQCCSVRASQTAYSAAFLSDVDLQHSCMRLVNGAQDDTDARVIGTLPPLFESNFAASPTLAWQYYGTQSGMYGIFPAKPRSSCNDYDCRFRPWYAPAATPYAQDIVIVIDVSGSMSTPVGTSTRIALAQDAINTALATLNPRDRVAIIAFASDVSTPSGCFASKLAVATPDNIATLIAYVNTLVPTSGTLYGNAFQAAFNLLASEPSAGRSRVILFATDGEPNDDPSSIYNTINAANPSHDIRIFTFGISIASSDILSTISNQNNGVFVGLPDVVNIRTQLGSYYNALTAYNPSQAPVWTAPYFDASGLGVVTTVTMPVFYSGQLKGVAGVDTLLSDLLSGLDHNDLGQYGYAFVVDDLGKVLVHPMLPQPREVVDPPVFVDVRELETAAGFGDVLTAMLARQSGSLAVTKDFVMPRGDSTLEGVVVQSLTASYHYRPIPGTTFSLAVVLADIDLSYVESLASSVSRPPVLPLYNSLQVEGGQQCALYGSPVTTLNTTFKLAPSAFANPSLFLQGGFSASQLADFQAYLAGDLPVTSVAPGLVLADASISRADLWQAATVMSSWSQAYCSHLSNYAIRTILGTTEGTFMSFPGDELASGYDPRLRPWYLLALSNTSNIGVTTPYVDAGGAGAVCTITQAIVPSWSGSSAAVIAIDLLLQKLTALLANYTQCDLFSTSPTYCVLIDDGGFIVWHPDMWRSPSASPVFLGTVLPELVTMLQADSHASVSQCNDWVSYTTRSFLKLTLPQPVNYTVNQAPCGRRTYTLASIPSTNLVLVAVDHVAGSCSSGSAVTLPTVPIGYDTCAGNFTGSSAVPACPPASTSALAPTTLSTAGLPDCFQCHSSMTQSQCDAMAGTCYSTTVASDSGQSVYLGCYFSASAANTSRCPTYAPRPPVVASGGTGNGLGKGAVIGVAVGVSAGVVVLALVVFAAVKCGGSKAKASPATPARAQSAPAVVVTEVPPPPAFMFGPPPASTHSYPDPAPSYGARAEAVYPPPSAPPSQYDYYSTAGRR